jgi:hypothetical protein
MRSGPRARTALAVASLLTVALLLPDASADVSQTFRFKGQAVPGKMQVHAVDLARTGSLSATLQWRKSSADLDLALQDPSGAVVGTGAPASPTVEQLEAHGLAPGAWTFVVTTVTGSTSYRLDVTVSLSNQPPVARDDSDSTREGTKVRVPVLENDGDPDGDELAVESASSPAFGTATVSPEGVIVYAPDPGASGTDTFTYQVCDPWDACSRGSVSVDVRDVAQAPVAGDDGATTVEDVAVGIDVLANDSDPDGDALSVSLGTPPGHGTADVRADGSIDYTPDAGWSGVDAFTYEACDPGGLCDGATVTVTVDPAPEPDPGGGGDAGPTVRAWAADFMTGRVSLTQARAVAQAERFDIISATRGTYRSYVGAMRAANPDLTLLVYLNGAFAQEYQETAYPDSWYARDSSGNKIQSAGWGNWLMDISNPGWVDDVVARCRSFMDYSGYDGCFIDMLGTAPLDPGYLTSLPINRATGKVWTKQEWLRATTNIASTVRASAAPAPVFGNGLGWGGRYFDATAPAEQLLDGLEGAMPEVFVRSPSGPIDYYRGETAWKQDVDMLVDAGARPSITLSMTKVWTTGTQAQKDSWHRYALATFLLGADEHAYFSFRYDHELTAYHPWWEVRIGSPTGRYAKVGGVYQRAFEGGLVLVNPTGSTVTVPLGGAYVTLDGDAVTSLSMAPHTGEVLRLSP